MNPPPSLELESLLAQRPRLVALARRLLADEHGAEEVVQEAWVRTLERGPAAGGAAWLTRVVQNLALDRRRAGQRRRLREERAARTELRDDEDPARVTQRLELQRDVLEAVLGLEEPLRSTLHARYFDDLAPRDIARRDGVPLDTVNDRLRRARRALRRELSGRLELDGRGLVPALLPLAGLSPRTEALILAGGPGAAVPLVPSLLEVLLVKKLLVPLVALLVLAGGWVLWPPDEAATPEVTDRPTALVLEQQPAPALEIEEREPIAPPTADERTSREEAHVAGSWTVAGRVTLGLEEPAPGVALEARTYRGTTREELLDEALLSSDGEGRFEWPLPPPTGTVRVEVRPRMDDAQHFPAVAVVSAGGAAPEQLHVNLYPHDAWIEGRVVDSAGRPLIDAEVFGRTAARTDAEGGFRLPTSSWRSQEYVSARTAGHAQVRIAVDPPPPGGATRVELVLPRAVALHGRVEDPLGRVLEGAVVAAFHSSGNEATTDARGLFTLEHLDPGHSEHMLRISRPGFASGRFAASSVGLTGDQDPRVFVLRPGTLVVGRVEDPAGRPLAGASVRSGFSPHAWDGRHAYSDERGRFELADLGAGETTLWVNHDASAPGSLPITVPEDARILEDVVVVLDPGRTVAGRAVDRDGRPASGVHVGVRHRSETTPLRQELDDQGRFELLHVPDGEVELTFFGRGWVRSRVVVPGGELSELVVPLERSGLLVGRVLDAASGEPVPDFRIRLHPPREHDGPPPSLTASWAREGHAFSDPEGRWSTEGLELAVGTLLGVEVQAAGRGRGRVVQAVVGPAEGGQELLLHLEGGQRLGGRVVRAGSEEPVEDAILRLQPLYSLAEPLVVAVHDAWDGGLARTDPAGDFAFEDVAPGTYRIDIEHVSLPRGAHSGPHEVRADVAPADLLVRIGGELAVRGVLEDPDGRPLADRAVELVGLELRGVSGEERHATRTDGAGRFAFTGLVEGVWRLREESATAGLAVVLRGEDSAEVRLGRGAGTRLEGRLVHDAGSPLEVHVELFGMPSLPPRFPMVVPHHGLTISSEDFVLEDVAPGNYQVEARGTDAEGTWYRARVELVVGEGERHVLELHLTP